MAERVLTRPGRLRLAPWSPRRDRLFDWFLVAGMLLPVVVFPSTGIAWGTTVFSFLEIAPLLLRRKRPELCFALVAGAMALQVLVLDNSVYGQVALPVATYSVAAFSGPLQARAALLVGLVGAVVGPVDWLLAADIFSPLLLMLWSTTAALLVIAPWAFGTLTRTRRAYVAELIDRGERLEREAEQQAALAASEERARIAREMHDIVSHGLSVMVVQADGARYAVQKDPDAAARALETISRTGREALADMRRMLGVLRSDDTETGTDPQPGLADLDALLDEARAAGLRLEAHVGPGPEVGAGVGLAAYRVVQEALTNVRKHAGPDPLVSVTVRRVDAELLVEVVDDGRGATAPDDGRGHGLLGMRERIDAVSGTFAAGPREGGGYRVSARIPLEEVR